MKILNLSEKQKVEINERLKWRKKRPKLFKWLLRGSAIVVLGAGGVITGAATFGIALPAWVAISCSIIVSIGTGTGITSYLTKQ